MSRLSLKDVKQVAGEYLTSTWQILDPPKAFGGSRSPAREMEALDGHCV